MTKSLYFSTLCNALHPLFMVVIHYLQSSIVQNQLYPFCFLNRKKHKTTRDFPLFHFFAFATTLGNGKMQKEVFSTFFLGFPLLNGFSRGKPFFTLAHSGVNQPFIREQLVFFQPLKNLLLTLVNVGAFSSKDCNQYVWKGAKKSPRAKKSVNDQIPKIQVKKLISCSLGIYSTSGKKFPQRGGWLLSHPDRKDCSTTPKVFLEQFKKLLAKLFPPPFLAIAWLLPSVSIWLTSKGSI